MEWYGKYWCISADELTRDDRTRQNADDVLAPIISLPYYKQLVHRGKINVVRRGGGRGCPALIEYNSLSQELKARVEAKYPDIDSASASLKKIYDEAFSYDHKARKYYMRTLTVLNQTLKTARVNELAEEYAVNASVVQAVIRLKQNTQLYRKVRQGGIVSWAMMADAIKYYKDCYSHTLGTTPSRFAQWAKKWESKGYDGLISSKFGNSNGTKISADVVEIIERIARDPKRPYKTTVLEYYNEFLRGERNYYDPQTGEVYQPELYPDLSERSVVNILEQMKTQMRMSRELDTRHEYLNNTRPYESRKKPLYSLSMVSLDDRDLPVKVRWTHYKETPVRGRKTMTKITEVTALKIYASFDVASSAIVGYAFDGTKEASIFEACMRDMFRTLIREGLGCPYEAQVEQHLVSDYKDTMMAQGALFSEVSFCPAENSRAKFAENFWRVFKSGYEKRYLTNIGRFYAKLKSNRVQLGKNFDGENNNYKQEVWEMEDAINFYHLLIKEYNHDLHPNQDLYPGKTRWEVLKECVHPKIEEIDMISLVQHLGYSCKTSIRQGVLTAKGQKWAISHPDTLDKLRPMDNKVEARWWEQEEGIVSELHIWQDARYIEQCQEVVPYQVSKLERTEADKQLMARESKRVATWDKYMDEHRIAPLACINNEVMRAVEEAEVKIVAMPLDGNKIESQEEIDEEEYRHMRDVKSARSRGMADL